MTNENFVLFGNFNVFGINRTYFYYLFHKYLIKVTDFLCHSDTIAKQDKKGNKQSIKKLPEIKKCGKTIKNYQLKVQKSLKYLKVQIVEFYQKIRKVSKIRN